MTPQQRDEILHALWPGGATSGPGVWAVFDCARDRRIYLALLESRLEFRCLYSGKLPQALEMVAPQLVELLPTNRLVQRWLDEGWGEAWGILLKVDDPSNLRHHLRKFLKVQDEDGRRLLFRYYDPRVLGAFLPTCAPDELRQIFGPIASFLAEDAADGSLVEYARRGNALATSRHAQPARVPVAASGS